MSNAITCQRKAIRAHLEEYGWIDKPTALALCDCFGHQTRYAVYRRAENGVEI